MIGIIRGNRSIFQYARFVFKRIAIFATIIVLIVSGFQIVAAEPPRPGENWVARDISLARQYKALGTNEGGTRIYVGVEGGAMYTSGNSGSTWTELTGAGIRDWNGVVANSGGSVVAATVNSGYIYTSSDTGATWTMRTSAGFRSWKGIAASKSAAVLAAVVNSGYIYTSSDTGATWTQRTSAGSRAWTSVAVSETGASMVAATASGYIYTSSDTGATWTERTSAGSRSWSSVATSSDGAKLVATTSSGYVYTSTDSGATWTERTSAGSRSWSNVTSSTNGSKLAATTNSGYIYTSTDSGATWTERTASGQRNWGKVVYGNNNSNIVAIANVGHIYTSSNDGADWSERIIGTKNWVDVASSADGSKLAVAAKNGYIYTSSDSGATWTERVGPGLRNWSSIASSADGTKLIAVVDGGYIYTSTNSGSSWTERTSAGSRNWVSVASSSNGSRLVVADGTIGFSSGTRGYIYTSSDYGATWTARAEQANGENWKEVAISGDGMKIYGAAYESLVYYSGDGGSTSTYIQPYEWMWPNQVAVSRDGGTALSTCSDVCSIYKTTNSGASWTEIMETEGVYDKNWSGIGLSADGSFILAANSGGGLYTSTDSGVNWSELTSAGTGNWKAVALSDDATKLIAVNSEGGVVTSVGTWHNSPGQPGDVSVVSGDGSLGLAWSKPSDDGGTPITGYEIGISDDDGDTWNSKLNLQYGDWDSLTASADGTTIAGLYNGDLWVSTDSGFSWERRNNADPGLYDNMPWYEVKLSADGSTMIAGIVNPDLTSMKTWHISYDLGETWDEMTALRSDSYRPDASAISSDGSNIIIGVNDNLFADELMVSNDYGNTWTSRYTLNDEYMDWYGIDFSEDGTKVIATASDHSTTGYEYIYTSTNSGVTWTKQTSAGARGWISATISADGSKMAAADNSGYIYTSADSGATWTARTSSGSRKWSIIDSSADGTVLLAITSNTALLAGAGSVFISTDSGSTWAEQSVLGEYKWKSGLIVPDTNMMIVAREDGHIYTSTDYGATWEGDSDNYYTTFDGLTPFVEYNLRVRSLNAVDHSDWVQVSGETVYMSLSAPTTASISVTPTSSARTSSIKQTVTVDTNYSSGYSLYLSTGGTDRNLVNGSNMISPTSGTLASPTSLGTNTWGYRVDGQGGFGSGPTTQETSVSSSAFNWAGVPDVNSPQIIKTTTEATEDDKTDVWFAVSVDVTKPSGNYAQTVVYTAIKN